MSKNQQIKKILLFGSTGMLGRYIYSYFINHPNLTLTKINFRISNDTLESLENILMENEINEETCVINCIGLIPQRKSALSMDKEYFLVNSIFPHLLWNICKKYNAKMIQPTTDCVFSGKGGGFYLEHDVHDESNAYGSSKSLGEPHGCTIVRTSIIGKELANKKSFLEWVISNNNNKINGFTDHAWNGITCLEYCKIIEQIITKNLFWNGVRHIYSPTPKSKYELACIIADTFSLTIEIEPLESSVALNKTLLSKHDKLFEIPELKEQINDLKGFILL
jgi:dTDP-4-dehydrorhamnose reductase